MTFALATLVFLVAAWAVIVLLAATLEEHWPAVRSALAGHGAFAPAPTQPIALRLRVRYDARRPLRARARPALRAAA